MHRELVIHGDWLGHNHHLQDIRDKISAIGAQNLPVVDRGSYSNGYGVSIENTEVHSQRVQTSVARLVMVALQQHITRGEISLDRPRD